MRPTLDDAGIRRYLLGLLPEPEAEALEAEYLARPDVFERIRAVEDDLLDDYAAGRLGPGEIKPFEGRYLVSPSLRERVVAARALRLARPRVARPAAARFVPAGPMRWAGLLAVAASLLVAILAFWLWPPSTPQVTTAPAPPTSVARSETPPGPASSPSPAASPPARERGPATTRLVFALSPVLLRGGEGPAELRIPPGTATVVLELEGDPAVVPPDTSRLHVVIETVEGGHAWSGEARRVKEPARPSLLASVRFPAETLAAGDYILGLSAPAPDGETLYRYFFRLAAR